MPNFQTEEGRCAQLTDPLFPAHTLNYQLTDRGRSSDPWGVGQTTSSSESVVPISSTYGCGDWELGNCRLRVTRHCARARVHTHQFGCRQPAIPPAPNSPVQTSQLLVALRALARAMCIGPNCATPNGERTELNWPSRIHSMSSIVRTELNQFGNALEPIESITQCTESDLRIELATGYRTPAKPPIPIPLPSPYTPMDVPTRALDSASHK